MNICKFFCPTKWISLPRNSLKVNLRAPANFTTSNEFHSSQISHKVNLWTPANSFFIAQSELYNPQFPHRINLWGPANSATPNFIVHKFPTKLICGHLRILFLSHKVNYITHNFPTRLICGHLRIFPSHRMDFVAQKTNLRAPTNPATPSEFYSPQISHKFPTNLLNLICEHLRVLLRYKTNFVAHKCYDERYIIVRNTDNECGIRNTDYLTWNADQRFGI